MHARSILLLLVVSAVSLPAGHCRSNPATGEIRVLFLGEFAAGNRIMLDWIVAEPRFVLTVVPCSLQNVPQSEAKRMTRLYVPRTYELLVGGYDALVFEDFGPMPLLSSAIENFRRGVEEGMGLALIEFANWQGVGSSYIDAWLATAMAGTFPALVDPKTDVPASEGRTFYKVVRRDPIFDLPGVESVPMNGGHHGDIFPKPGSVVQAEWRGRGTPALITGSYGEGNTLQLDHGWDNTLAEARVWEYCPDLIYNQVLFVAAEPVPPDLEIAHQARKLFIEARIRRVVTVSTLDFIEKFGGTVIKAARKLQELDGLVEEAERSYVKDMDPLVAVNLLNQVMDRYPELEVEMMELKQRSLLWIYVIEWCVVSATATVTAGLVWTLMVKRARYRLVETTRLQR